MDYRHLFRVLADRGTDQHFLRVLAYAYVNQSGSVEWNGAFSPSFSILNGVRQGGILSPPFFAVYID